MNTELLKQFIDVIETGSFTEAGKRNGVTQSAVSQGVAALEGNLNVRLVERSKRGCRLTNEGMAIWDEMKKVMENWEAIPGAIERVRKEIGGRIEVATTESIGLHELSEYVKIFMNAYAGTDVRVGYGRTGEVYEQVVGNVVDLGVVSNPTVRAGKLKVVPVRKERLALVCHPTNALAQAGTIGVNALAGQKFIGFEPEGKRLRLPEAMFGGSRVEQVMAFDNVETVKRAVEVGAGLAIVPEDTVRQEVGSGVLARVALRELDGEECCHVLAVIHRKTKVLSAAAQQFIEVMKGGS